MKWQRHLNGIRSEDKRFFIQREFDGPDRRNYGLYDNGKFVNMNGSQKLAKQTAEKVSKRKPC